LIINLLEEEKGREALDSESFGDGFLLGGVNLSEGVSRVVSSEDLGGG